MRLKKPQTGFTLVEIMISITLGLIILAAVASVFVNSKQGYRVQDSSGRIQENSRYAMDTISHAIRNADFWGGVKPNLVTTISSTTYTGTSSCKDAWLVNPADGVHGYAGGASNPVDSSGTVTAACFPSVTYIPYSDVLALRFANPDAAVCTNSASGCSTTAAALLNTATTPNLNANGDFYLRSLAGRRAVLFNINTSADVATAQSTGSGGITGDETSGVLNYQYAANVFYIGNKTYGSTTVPTLYATQLTHSGTNQFEVAEGVEMIKFEYGIDSGTTGKPNYVVGQWLDAGTVSSWSQVISIRVSMILRGDTLDNYQDSATYQMTASGFCYGPPSSSCTAKYTADQQRYQRRMVVKEVQVRNRIRS